MIARASGAYCSLPVPSFSAIGANPIMVASDVIKIGRSRTRHDVITESSTARPWPSCRCANSTIRMRSTQRSPPAAPPPASARSRNSERLAHRRRHPPDIHPHPCRQFRPGHQLSDLRRHRVERGRRFEVRRVQRGRRSPQAASTPGTSRTAPSATYATQCSAGPIGACKVTYQRAGLPSPATPPPPPRSTLPAPPHPSHPSTPQVTIPCCCVRMSMVND